MEIFPKASEPRSSATSRRLSNHCNNLVVHVESVPLGGIHKNPICWHPITPRRRRRFLAGVREYLFETELPIRRGGGFRFSGQLQIVSRAVAYRWRWRKPSGFPWISSRIIHRRLFLAALQFFELRLVELFRQPKGPDQERRRELRELPRRWERSHWGRAIFVSLYRQKCSRRS